ncbi:carbohydrate kinase family protein [Frateuria terrea]|uniref:Sugar or nucleoside kinase, ribokinase family n=1 Tax=Frateuria terrea TaxID=529704 RepID=A0A1H6QQI6_9GAMM|nr:carbohydrate kinase family protein [Frateuria terrea]SEI45941.1 Sugar or nucleoside kinase, ribokinase family [Frateuria terrea]SFP11800.1 Sugar or nucleoside kinase, ribokinase family [Frateuria terrea]
MKPVLVAGEINADLVFSGCSSLPAFGREVLAEGFQQGPGSSSMICAMGLARLGEAVLFAGVAGQDGWGGYCVAALREAGIDVAAVQLRPDLRTGLTVALSAAHDRALVTYPGAIAALRADDIPDALLARAGHLHVSSYYLQDALRPGLRSLLERARALGLGISLDPGFDPQEAWGETLVEMLPLVDVFLPNALEACAISGAPSPEAALEVFANGRTRTVVKRGGEGCITLDDDGRMLAVPAFAVGALDSTGAGDSFDAGFLYAWRRRLPLRDCLRWGAACGALSTRGIGGTATQAGVADVERLLADQP